ncbi:PLDc N-terminal domain-containing protein [Winogradskyella sp. A3E31]|uniref:PLDc N-terminal domain-containing protein n=1 Tax=Winogradskyella sp. A3E31 TaxID=3349637 RepID=UPI00398ADB73
MDFVTSEMGLIFWTIFGLLILAFPLIALISILKNNFRGNEKFIWILVVLFLPVLGSLLYFIIGRSKRIK